MRRVGGAVLVALAVVLALAGCTTASPRITVTELEGPFAPLGITLAGLEPGQEVTLESRATVGGTTFRARARFAVPGDGTVDLAEHAPVDGDWDVADPMAPIWAMAAGGRADPAAWDRPHRIDLAVLGPTGDVLAESTVDRAGYAPDVEVRDVDAGGLVAEYAVPAATSPGERRPAVLVFGGSEGGPSTGAETARWIAGLGYPALGISYFRGPGQPTALHEVPVETFLDALAHLQAQPEVDPDAVATFGVSRGGEMALWLAAEQPSPVAAAIAPTGAESLVCGHPDAGRHAWTLAGEPLTEECFAAGGGSVPSASLVDVAAIEGPVLLACGGRDELWSACTFAERVVERRGDRPTTLVREDAAGHLVAVAPYLPRLLADDELERAGVPSSTADPAATHRVRVELWSQVDALLAGLRPEG